MTKHLQIVLDKMGEIINVNMDTIDCAEQEWYYKHSWTDAQQEEFKAWMTEYLQTNKEARHELLDNPTTDKKRIEKAVNEFIFNYGWRTE